jgi:hypothetical protein
MGHSRAMGEVMRNGLSLWRWNRWFQVRVVWRWRHRGSWPTPKDIDRMSTDEREAWFKSIGLDESIDAALREDEEERDQDRAEPTVSTAQAGVAGRRDASRT